MYVTITFDPRVNQWDEGMHQDETGALFRKDVAAGAACWVDSVELQNAVLKFACPCGCGYIVGCPVIPPGKSGWTFDGNLESPTLTPSILRTAGCRWHGYLTKGIFISC